MKELGSEQGAFFLGEDGSITPGKVEVLSDGTPNVGRARRLEDLRAEGILGLSRLGELNEQLGKDLKPGELGGINQEKDEVLGSIRQNIKLIEEHLGFPEK